MSTTTKAVQMFAENARGERISSFHVNGLTVNIVPPDKEANELGFKMACDLSRKWQELAGLQETILAQAKEIKALRSSLPEAPKTRLLGRGCVRFLDGDMYLLSHRAKGWASFAVKVDGWDDLFRRYNVLVVEHGTDEHGAWWEVENIRSAA